MKILNKKLVRSWAKALTTSVAMMTAAPAALAQEKPLTVATVLKAAETDYSRELTRLEDRFTDLLKQVPGTPPKSGIIILDPDKFDALTALGISPVDSVLVLLKDGGLQATPARAAGLLKYLKNPVSLPSGTVFEQTSPSATLIKHPEAHVCLVVPASVTEEARRTAANLHELWHCLEHEYAESEDEEKLSPEQIRARDAAGNKSEIFADLGAAGELVRAGHPLSDIERLALWREQRVKDVLHLSAPALRDLQRRIEAMGVEKFKALAFPELFSFYRDIAERHSPSLEKMEILSQYENATPEQRQEMQNSTDPLVRETMEFVRYVDDLYARKEHQPAAEKPQRLLLAWEPQRILAETAHDIGSKITPETLIRAHAELQNKLREEIGQSPTANDRMALLKNTFLKMTHEAAAGLRRKPSM